IDPAQFHRPRPIRGGYRVIAQGQLQTIFIDVAPIALAKLPDLIGRTAQPACTPDRRGLLTILNGAGQTGGTGTAQAEIRKRKINGRGWVNQILVALAMPLRGIKKRLYRGKL